MSCRSGTIVGESIFGVALVPSLGTLGINVFHSRFLFLYSIFLSETRSPHTCTRNIDIFLNTTFRKLTYG